MKNHFESDGNWIKARLNDIPESRRDEVFKEYCRIYQTSKIERRRKANQYLSAIATEYRQDKHAKAQM